MPKKKSKDTPAAQYRRFVDTAKSLEVDESGKAFERAVAAVMQPPPKKPPKKP